MSQFHNFILFDTHIEVVWQVLDLVLFYSGGSWS